MDEQRVLLRKIAELCRMPLCAEADGQMDVVFTPPGTEGTVFLKEELRAEIEERAGRQSLPVLMQDRYGFYLGCIRSETGFLFFGPAADCKPEHREIARAAKKYGYAAGEEFPLCVMAYTLLMSFAETLCYVLNGTDVPRERLIAENHLGDQLQRSMEDELSVYSLQSDEQRSEQVFIHHSYEDEQKLLRAVRDGRSEHAIALSMIMDQSTGRLSASELQHWIKSAVASVTLCTRAAISGGVPPERAYRISDFYIRKLDEYRDVHALIECRNHAIWDLTEEVRKNPQRRHADYAELCRDYVCRHYTEKVRLSDIAAELQVSEGHLSRSFSQKEGMTFKQFLLNYRLEKAAELLRYSEKELIQISEQLQFSSPAYFGRVFKERYGVTPRQYRVNHR